MSVIYSTSVDCVTAIDTGQGDTVFMATGGWVVGGRAGGWGGGGAGRRGSRGEGTAMEDDSNCPSQKQVKPRVHSKRNTDVTMTGVKDVILTVRAKPW